MRTSTNRHHKMREGRGFSLEELKRAGLTLHEARQEVPIDKRRRTAHPENIKALKKHFGAWAPLTEIKGIGKATEEELREVGILDAYDLVRADVGILSEKVAHSKKTLDRWQDEAKKLLKNK